MSVVWRSVLLSSVLFAAGCAIPERNNPHDPALAPKLRLTVSNAAPALDAFGKPDVAPDGTRLCDLAAERTITTEFRRGRCLVLDVTGSEGGDGAEIASIRFDTHYDGPGDDTWDDVPADTLVHAVSGLEIVPQDSPDWPEPLIGEEVTSVTFRVRVRVKDTRGSVAQEVREITLTNRPPVAIAPPPAILDANGAIWEGFNAALHVRLDGGKSIDDDGDDLRYCWAEDDGNSLNGCRGDQAVFGTAAQFAIDTPAGSSQPRTYQLAVSDGSFRSPLVLTTVVMRNSQRWGYDENDGSAVQLDMGRQMIPVPNQANGKRSAVSNIAGGGFAVAYPDDPSTPGMDEEDVLSVYLAYATTAQGIALTPNERIVHVEPYTCPDYSDPSPPDEGVTRFWVFTADDGGLAQVHVVETTYPSTQFALVGSWTAPPGQASTDGIFVAIDVESRDARRGTMWFVPQFGTTAFGLRYAGGTVTLVDTIDTPPGYMPTGLAFRKPFKQGEYEPELWSMFGRDVTLGGNVVTAFASVRPGSTSECQTPHDVTFETPPAVAWSLNFDSDRTAWSNYFTEGVARLRLEFESFPCEQFLREESMIPDVPIGFDYSIDSGKQELMMLEQGGGAILRALPGGIAIRTQTSVPARRLFPQAHIARQLILFDGLGGDPATLMLTNGADLDGVMTRTTLYPSPIETTHAAEYPTGRLWLGTIFPVGVQRVDPTGAVSDFVTNVSVSALGLSEPMSPPVVVRSDPASGELWIFSTDDLFAFQGASKVYRTVPDGPRVDPATLELAEGFAMPSGWGNVPLGLRVLDAAVQPSYDPESTIVLASTDTSGSQVLRLLRFDLALTMPPLADKSVTDIGGELLFHRDIATNEISLFYRDDTNDLVLRRYPADLSGSGAVHSLGVAFARPEAIECIQGHCFVAWSGSGGGFAWITPSGEIRPWVDNGEPPPSNPEGLHVAVAQSNQYYRVTVLHGGGSVLFQCYDNPGAEPYGEPFSVTTLNHVARPVAP